MMAMLPPIFSNVNQQQSKERNTCPHTLNINTQVSHLSPQLSHQADVAQE
jgi:hypothetical protein